MDILDDILCPVILCSFVIFFFALVFSLFSYGFCVLFAFIFYRDYFMFCDLKNIAEPYLI